jgi:MFS family permease
MTFAIQMQNVITGWFLYSLTNDPLTLGIVGLAEAMPAILFALFAGNLVDKFDKRKILMITFSLYGVCTLGFAWAASHFAVNMLSVNQIVWCFYIILFCLGLARSFAGPASFSALGYLFPKSMMTKVTPISSTAWQLGAIFGPAAGGFIYAFTTPAISSLIVTFFIILSVISASRLPAMPVIPEAVSGEAGLTERIKEGLRYVFKHKVILSSISLDLFAVLFGGAVALLPVFAKDILHVGATELGWLRAAPSAGAAIVLLFMSVKPPEHHTGWILLIAVAGFGLCMIGFANSTHLWLSLFLLFASGAFDAVSVVIRGTILQIFTPDRMKGRVAAVNTIFIGSSNEIGAFESGAAARWLGTVPSVNAGAAITILVVITTAIIAPQLRNLELKTIEPDQDD